MTTENTKQPKSFKRFVWAGGINLDKGSVGRRLFLAVMGGVTVGLGSLTYIFYRSLEAQALKIAETRLQVEVTELDGNLRGGESFLKALASSTVAIKESGINSPEPYETLIRNFMQARPNLITGFGVMQTPNSLVDTTTWYGPYIEETVQGRGTPLPNNPKFSFVDLWGVDRYPKQDYYKDPLASNQLIWTEPYVAEGYPIPLTTFGGQIKDAQGKIIAVLNGDVSLFDLQKIAKRTVYEGKGYFVALTGKGKLLAYPPDPQKSSKLASVTQIPALQPLWEVVQQQLKAGKTSGYIAGQTDSYWFYEQVPSTGWILLAQVPNSAVTTPALVTSMSSAVVVAILLYIIVVWFVRSLNQRLNPILEECAKLTEVDSDEVLFDSNDHLDELERLSIAFFSLLDQQNQLAARQSAEVSRAQLVRNIVMNLSQTLTPESVYRATIQNIQQILPVDRVLIYKLHPNSSGEIVDQSAQQPGSFMDLLDQANGLIPFTTEDGLDIYQQGQLRVVADVNITAIARDIQQQASALNIRACVTAPIFVEGQLWGLLLLHDCQNVREWQTAELDLLSQVATQVGLNLERAFLIDKAEGLARERLEDKETLQNQLIQLLDSIEGAAMGDLTVRAEVSNGAMGTVGDFFNAIVESLRSIVTQVKQSAEKVSSSVTSNGTAIRQLANDALRQVSEVNQTLDSIQSMANAIQQVADSAQEAAEVAHIASETAISGEAAMDSSVSSILNLRGTIAETSKKVKRLGESSQQISKAVVLINQLATKTKLLAINASIEAALAGESGQGFAVVAEEVGQLAAQSASATQDIAKIVDLIQQEVGEVVQAMEEGTLQVVEGTKLVEETRHSLGQVLDVSRQIDKLVASISSATAAQVETSETVTQLMQQIAAVSEQTAGTSRQVSEALNETVVVTEQLQASVGTFKL